MHEMRFPRFILRRLRSRAEWMPLRRMLPNPKKTAKRWNSRRHKHRRKPCWMQKRAATALSMPAWKFALHQEMLDTRSAPRVEEDMSGVVVTADGAVVAVGVVSAVVSRHRFR